MLNFFFLLAGKVALIVTMTWKADEIRELCRKWSVLAATLRMDKLKNAHP